MNKFKVLMAFSAIFLAFVVIYSLFPKTNSKNLTLKTPEPKTPEVLGSPDINEEVLRKEIVFNQEKFTVISIKVENIENIVLGSNLLEKYSSDELFARLDCTVLISGGFYTKENTPVGLFIEDGNLSKNFLTNHLFDGVFSINFSLTPRITREVPKDGLKYAVQSGPMLIENSFIQKLSIRNDKPARRVVAATTGDNEIVFMIIYDEISKLVGPDLKDLPNILDVWQTESGISLADAINLDGGSASAFISEEIKLTESSPIGSYFCL